MFGKSWHHQTINFHDKKYCQLFVIPVHFLHSLHFSLLFHSSFFSCIQLSPTFIILVKFRFLLDFYWNLDRCRIKCALRSIWLCFVGKSVRDEPRKHEMIFPSAPHSQFFVHFSASSLPQSLFISITSRHFRLAEKSSKIAYRFNNFIWHCRAHGSCYKWEHQIIWLLCIENIKRCTSIVYQLHLAQLCISKGERKRERGGDQKDSAEWKIRSRKKIFRDFA